ncbi:hypothetical protein EJB05_25907, partial [Eragrostis curvula]
MATILYTLVGSCIKKLQDIATEEAILVLGVKEEIIDLQRRMNQIQCFLHDTERNTIEESADSNWLGQLRGAMYDADDIIDIARSKGRNLLPDNSLSSSGKSITCSGLSISSCSNFRTRHEVATKVRILNKRIENIMKDKVFSSLTHTQSTKNVSAQELRKSSNLVEPNLVGKEVMHACRKVVNLVLAHKGNKSYKLAIVGTGGVGKTTLAQKIYNDQKIKWNFNKQAWVCVSKDNICNAALLKEVLRYIGLNQEQGESVGELQSNLASAIKDKNFFLVLDDVWQSNTWTDLLRTPLHAAATVVVLVTTRHDTIAMEIGVDDMHRVDLMSVDVGWELLWKSMNINEEREVYNLRDIGIEIVQKCGRLPLGIKLIARVLASKDQTENEWMKVLRKDAWSMSNLPSEIKGALYLSYEELPHYLKQCFVYCALFPEDKVILQNDFVRMWVAEGFIVEKDGQLLEDTAEEYYYELIYRNLLQPDFSVFDHRQCRVHDLLMQLACYLSREECFVGDPESIGINNLSKIRRISVFTEKDMVVLPIMDKEKYKVRTWRTSYENKLRVDTTIFRRLTCIRVLDLTDSLVHNIPSCIGSLIHLRLLDLNATDISYLPESICHLINLQILNLDCCSNLHSLPSGITQLCNLRHLGLAESPINQVPKGIGRLKFLNDLGGYPVGGDNDNDAKIQDGWNLEELGPLLQLRKLNLIKLERGTHCASDFLLFDKKHLKDLWLNCTERTNEPYSEEDVINIENIFEMLIPPRNLEHLSITDFFARRFPSWLGSATYLASLKNLSLTDCKSCVHLPPIGQLPNLKYLKVKGATAVTKIGPEFIGCGVLNPRSTGAVAFPMLEGLAIRDLPNWEEWSFFAEEEATTSGEIGGEGRAAAANKKREAVTSKMQLLPRLKRLELSLCPKLRSLPWQLGQEATGMKELLLRDVDILQVVENLPFLSELVYVAYCEGLERVSNIPQVRMMRTGGCPNLRCVENLSNLQQLGLHRNMKNGRYCCILRMEVTRTLLHLRQSAIGQATIFRMRLRIGAKMLNEFDLVEYDPILCWLMLSHIFSKLFIWHDGGLTLVVMGWWATVARPTVAAATVARLGLELALVSINGFCCRWICAATGFAVAIPMGAAPEASCGAAFPISCRSRHAVAASAVAIPMGAANGGSHGVSSRRHQGLCQWGLGHSGRDEVHRGEDEESGGGTDGRST